MKKKITLKPIYNMKEINYHGDKITIKSYLEMEEKLNIVHRVLQESMEDGFVNSLKVEAIFNVLVCAKYTNIDFSDDLDDIYNLYDIIKTTDLLKRVVEVCNDDYLELKDLLFTMVSKQEKYLQSFMGAVMSIINEVPEKVKEASNMLNEINPEKMEELFNIVKSAGGDSFTTFNSLVK